MHLYTKYLHVYTGTSMESQSDKYHILPLFDSLPPTVITFASILISDIAVLSTLISVQTLKFFIPYPKLIYSDPQRSTQIRFWDLVVLLATGPKSQSELFI